VNRSSNRGAKCLMTTLIRLVAISMYAPMNQSVVFESTSLPRPYTQINARFSDPMKYKPYALDSAALSSASSQASSVLRTASLHFPIISFRTPKSMKVSSNAKTNCQVVSLPGRGRSAIISFRGSLMVCT
jgi:hypothetical protein